MADVNSKIKTLWTLAGRVVDSREILDANGAMLAGRIDIPESLAVAHEGYSKVEYRVTHGSGKVTVANTFKALIETLKGVVESKPGSGIMTVYVPRLTSDGLFQIDVYKEWAEADPEPEEAESPFVRAILTTSVSGFGIQLVDSEGKRTAVMFQSNNIDGAVARTNTIKALEKRLDALEEPSNIDGAVSKTNTIKALEKRIAALEKPAE